jgi:hypothetical protein
MKMKINKMQSRIISITLFVVSILFVLWGLVDKSNNEENWLRLIIWGVLCLGLGLFILKGTYEKVEKTAKEVIHLDKKEAEAIKEKAIKDTIVFIKQRLERAVLQRSYSHFTKEQVFEIFKEVLG